MPCGQARGVECEACAARHWAAEGLASGEHGGVLRAEADGFAKLYEVASVKTATVQKRLDVAGKQTRFLIRKLRRACERRHDIFVKSYVADGEDALVAAHLKRRLDDDKSALVLLNVQLLN